MPTAAERNALLFLASIALIGAGVRSVESARLARALRDPIGQPSAEGSAAGQGTLGDRALAAQISAVDSARAARSAKATRSPNSSSRGQRPKPTNRNGTLAMPAAPLMVNVNSASAKELERLPRVGPALAARIVAWREEHGPFHSIDDLRHVRGIGPSTSSLLAPVVTF